MTVAIDHEFNKGRKPTEGDNLQCFKGDGIDRVAYQAHGGEGWKAVI